MDADDRIDELLDRWEELKAAGTQVTPEELCRDCPELLEEVRRNIRALQWVPDRVRPGEDQSEMLTFSSQDSEGRKIEHSPVPTTLGRYRLESPLGAGGFGQVWKAHDPDLNRYVAIKVPRPDRISSPKTVDRFTEEAKKVAQLRHPGIVPVYDVGQQDRWCYIVSEWVDGQSLAERLEQGPIPWHEAVEIVAAVAGHLHYAHQQGYVHRDVKPANVLLDGEGTPFLTDFGIAVTHEQLAEEQDPVSGTLAYMSPEQVAADATRLDVRTDVYSLGVVLYELLAGHRPFVTDRASELRGMILNDMPSSPCTNQQAAPASLEQVCLRALAKRPEDRFQTAEEFGDALREIKTPNRRRGVVVASVVAVVACLVSLLVYSNWNTGSPGEPTGPTAPSGVAKTLVPVAHFTFDNPDDRFGNTGSLGVAAALTPRGNVTFTEPGDPDAPPKGLGTGVRIVGENKPAGLVCDKSLLTGRAWTIAVWFRRNQVNGDDFIVYVGGLDGHGGGSPELNVLVSQENILYVKNYPTDQSKDRHNLLRGIHVEPKTWHHLVLTFAAEKTATNSEGHLNVYINGRQVGDYDNVFLATLLRHGPTALVFGAVHSRHSPHTWERTLDGVIGDIRIFDKALAAKQIKELHNQARSLSPPELSEL